jgi:hypothetical protein
MGVVISAIATGFAQNIEKDFMNQKVVDEYQSKGKPVEDEEIIEESKAGGKESVATPGFPTIQLDIPPLHNEGYLNTHNKNKSEKSEDSIKDPKIETVDLGVSKHEESDDALTTLKEESKASNEDEGNDESLSFLQDFFSSLRITSPDQDKVDIKEVDEKQESPKHTVTFADDLVDNTEDGGMINDYEDSTFPIINLLPRLTSDLAAEQRRPNPAWFRKSYTNTATVQKVYLTHPKYTPAKRPRTRLMTIKRPESRSVSLMNTPLHSRIRVRTGKDILIITPLHTRSGRDSKKSTPLYTRISRNGMDSVLITPLRPKSGRDSVRSTPLHSRSGRDRHWLCEDGCSPWRSEWDRQGRQVYDADGKHMKQRTVSLTNSPRRRKKKELIF